MPTSLHPSRTCDEFLGAARAIAERQLAPRAAAIDRGEYPADVLRALGEAGLFRQHLDRHERPRDFRAAIAGMAEVSRVCMATGFMTWCQDVCGLYIEQSGNPALISRFLAAHEAGAVLGGTGLSNPMKFYSGIERLLLTARRVPGGWSVRGGLPWVSNIGPGHHFGAVASIEGQDGTEVMFLLPCDAPGVTLRPCAPFSGMEGTGTYGVRLDDVFISEDLVIADPMRPWLARIKGGFILLQTGMALGLVTGCIESIEQVERSLGEVNRYLQDRPSQLADEAAALKEKIWALAEDPYQDDPHFMLEVLAARAEGSMLSLRAAQSALLHQGARGYVMSSPVQRRVRESHFVAIVTPALKHLRKEMDRISAGLAAAAA